jgi:hypothetical protein
VPTGTLSQNAAEEFFNSSSYWVARIVPSSGSSLHIRLPFAKWRRGLVINGVRLPTSRVVLHRHSPAETSDTLASLDSLLDSALVQTSTRSLSRRTA